MAHGGYYSHENANMCPKIISTMIKSNWVSRACPVQAACQFGAHVHHRVCESLTTCSSRNNAGARNQASQAGNGSRAPRRLTTLYESEYESAKRGENLRLRNSTCSTCKCGSPSGQTTILKSSGQRYAINILPIPHLPLRA